MITQMDLFERLKLWITPVDWEAAFTEQLPRVYNYFRYRGLPDDAAEDLTAAVFEKAWRGRDSYRRERGAMSTWMLAIARRAAVDHYRAQRDMLDIDTLELPDPHPGPEDLAQRSEQHEHLRRLLAALPERESELVALKYGAGLTNRAIAQHTGLSESNVGTILSRVVNFLRAQMEQDHA
jgi:RNA polymerase sigma-70 factor, ECF subfamily